MAKTPLSFLQASNCLNQGWVKLSHIYNFQCKSMKFLDWYVKIAVVSAAIGGSMEYFMIKTGFCKLFFCCFILSNFILWILIDSPSCFIYLFESMMIATSRFPLCVLCLREVMNIETLYHEKSTQLQKCYPNTKQFSLL